MEHVYDMIVVGGGPGGYTAAMYAARAGMDVLVLEKLSAGGQMALTSQVDNYPGFPEGIDGFELGDAMEQQALRFGVKTELAEVYSAELTAQPKRLHTSEGDFLSRTVVIATGAEARRLGLPMEWELTGRGVNYCAHCDGHFYRNKTVVVVGGGNTAAADALLLSRICKKVIVVHRRDSLRATKIYHEPLMKADNVEFVWNAAVTELLHDERLTGVRILDQQTGESREILCDGLFVSIGREPNTALFPELIKENGYIVADETTQTNIPGVYAVGDVRTKLLRQIVTAVADGAMAAHMAEHAL